MSLPPPPSKIHSRYTRLLAMQERGTQHEAAVATTKIDSLKKRFDFTKIPLPVDGEEPAEDLFAEAAHVHPDSSMMRELVVFDMQEAAIGNFVKWVLYEALKINGVWRTVKGSHSTALYVGAKKEDLPHLRHIATVITERFKSLWAHFVQTTGADPCDEPSFHAGLYAGLMREPRSTGKAVPGRAPKRKKGRAKKKVVPITPTVRPHPYSVGLELGAQIRINRTLGEITALLDGLVGLEAA